MIRKRVTKDFETRSQCDLKKAGAYKYSLHPTTRPTCLAFKLHGENPVYFLDFKTINTPWAKLPLKFKTLWLRLVNEGYEFSAHNSFFERCIYDNILVSRYGWPPINPKMRRCTAAKAAACALPRSLEKVGEALKLHLQKDKRGYNAMMATCKPTRHWNAWTKARAEIAAGKRVGPKKRAIAEKPEPPMFLEPEDAPDVWQTLYTYCKIDVRVEEMVDDVLPDLIPQEQEVWHFNQKLNWRGLRVDLPTVEKIVGIMEIESKKKLKELDKLTMGLVTKPGARKSILEFLELDDVILPDIRAKTVDEMLDGFTLSEDGRRLLEIRKALSKTSTRKYQSFINRANDDSKVRDIQLYHGASTGRDSGSGIQIHNFPRGLVKVDKARPYAHVQNVIDCDEEFLKILYGDSLGLLFSALLRNMIMPDDGFELYVADFSKIEVAVLWWLADNLPGLKILLSGKDPYIYQASSNTGKTYEEIEKAVNNNEPWALDARQLGKAQILGGGFGMGKDKFKTTAWDMYRLKLTELQSKIAIDNYRAQNAAVPALWKTYEQAAISVVEQGEGSKVVANKCTFSVQDKFLIITLPSGRPLFYREPQIVWRTPTYDVVEYQYKGDWYQQTYFDNKITKGLMSEGVTEKLKSRVRQVEGKPQKTLEFWAVNSKTKKWSLERTWGGTLTENIVQAVARDLLMYGMVRLEKKGYQGLFSVHDEAACQAKKGSIDTFVNILCEPPKWARGCPIEAKGWIGPRYRK